MRIVPHAGTKKVHWKVNSKSFRENKPSGTFLNLKIVPTIFKQRIKNCNELENLKVKILTREFDPGSG